MCLCLCVLIIWIMQKEPCLAPPSPLRAQFSFSENCALRATVTERSEAEQAEHTSLSVSEEEVHASGEEKHLPKKRRKIVVNRRGRSDLRSFRSEWKDGREWLMYDKGQGM